MHMMKSLIAAIVMSLLLHSQAPAFAQRATAVQMYTAPEMNLAEVDQSILDQVGVGGRINFAAYVLSDYSIIDSLRGAAEKGARVRLYLDPEELHKIKLSPDHPFVRLAHTRNVEIKVKSPDEGLMHLKAYSVNGVMLRTGSANESRTGLERQDNDLLIITDKEAVGVFDRKFEMMWARPSNTTFSYP
jgi:phosphatidylserine/phosphatidylglycerophosphate/cardiolipin synthase-like enzyme